MMRKSQKAIDSIIAKCDYQQHMNLKSYLTQIDPVALAKAAGTKPVYLSQLASGHRKASHKLAKRIEHASKGKVTRQDLRPDIFGKAA